MTRERFSTQLTVGIDDINYGGHVGNDRFLLFFQEARLRFLAGFGMSEAAVTPELGLIMTEARVRYLAQVGYGETLTIQVTVADIQKIRFTLRYQAVLAGSGQAAAEGETTLAVFDYNKGRPGRMPEALREALTSRLETE